MKYTQIGVGILALIVGVLLVIGGGGQAQETFTEVRVEDNATGMVDIATINETAWVVAYEDGGTVQFSKTVDAGQTWTAPIDLDPTIAGTLDVDIEVQNETIYGVVQTNPNQQRVWVQHTLDGGATWTREEIVFTGSSSNQTRSTSLSISPDGSRWAVVYNTEQQPRSWAATSDDFFNTTLHHLPIDNNAQPQHRTNAIDVHMVTSGLIYVGAHTFQNNISFYESTDAGGTWTKVGDTDRIGDSGDGVRLTVIDSENIGLAHNNFISGDGSFVVFARSGDAGRNWDTFRVNDTSTDGAMKPALIGFNDATWVLSWPDSSTQTVAKTTNGGFSWEVQKGGNLSSDSPTAETIGGVVLNDTAYLLSTDGTFIQISDQTEIGSPLLTPAVERTGFNDLTDIRTTWSETGAEEIYVRDPRATAPTIGEIIRMDTTLATITTSLTCDGGGGMSTPDTEFGLYVTKDNFVIEACELDDRMAFDISPANLVQTDQAISLPVLTPAGVVEARTLNNVSVLEAVNTERAAFVDFANVEGQWVKELNIFDLDLSKNGNANTALVGTFGTRLISPEGLTLAADSGKTADAVAVNGSRVYIALETANSIERLDRTASTFAVNGSVAQFVDPNGMRLSKDGRILFAWGSDQLTLIDAALMEAVVTINTGLGSIVAADIAFGNDNLYVANATTVQRYDITPLGFQVANFTKEVTEETELEGDPGTLPEFEPTEEGILGQTIELLASPWGLAKTGVAILISILIIAIITMGFAAISPHPIVIAAGILLGVAATFLLGLLPLWVLFIIGFITLALGSKLFLESRERLE